MASGWQRCGQACNLSTSEDEGETWSTPWVITLASQDPGHLLELQDGRILLTCGSRIRGQYGVAVEISDDYGESWTMPESLISVLCKLTADIRPVFSSKTA